MSPRRATMKQCPSFTKTGQLRSHASNAYLFGVCSPNLKLCLVSEIKLWGHTVIGPDEKHWRKRIWPPFQQYEPLAAVAASRLREAVHQRIPQSRNWDLRVDPRDGALRFFSWSKRPSRHQVATLRLVPCVHFLLSRSSTCWVQNLSLGRPSSKRSNAASHAFACPGCIFKEPGRDFTHLATVTVQGTKYSAGKVVRGAASLLMSFEKLFFGSAVPGA